MSEINDLIKRLLEGEGADRELDAAIAVQLLNWCLHENLERDGAQDDTGFTCLDCGADSWGNRKGRRNKLHEHPPAFTASLDACRALQEEALPSVEMSLDVSTGTHPAVVVLSNGKVGDDYYTYRVGAKSIERAWLAALLRAAESERNKELTSDIAARLRKHDAEIPPEVEGAITRPHEHEGGPHHRPVWLVWHNKGEGDGWWLAAVGDSQDMARSLYRQTMGGAARREPLYVETRRTWIERIPLNHLFASSLRTEEFGKIMGRTERKSIERLAGHPYYKGREGD